MKTFIAGHTGMVGSALIRLKPKGQEVVVAPRSEINLTNSKEVRDFLSENKVDAVIMAAARVGGIKANSEHQKDFLLENLKIQNAVIEAAYQTEVKNFVFLGSSCIYPKHAPQPIKESEMLSGYLEGSNEGYAIAKIAGVKLTNAIFCETGWNYFSVMPTNLYGPNDNYDLDSSHVPAALMRRFHEAKENNHDYVEVWGEGKVLREFMHVDDLANAIWFLVAKHLGGELINIGTGQEISIKDFATLMSDIVGYKGKIDFDSEKPEGTPRKLLDVSKVQTFGWNSQIELRTGLDRTYQWFQDALLGGNVRGY